MHGVRAAVPQASLCSTPQSASKLQAGQFFQQRGSVRATMKARRRLALRDEPKLKSFGFSAWPSRRNSTWPFGAVPLPEIASFEMSASRQ
jgi:hypothetical protein